VDVARLHKPRTVYGDLKGGRPDVLDALFIPPTTEVRKRSRRRHRVRSDCGFRSGEYNWFERGSLIGDFFLRGITLLSESGAVESAALRFPLLPPQL